MKITKAYLIGALHDATVRKNTFRLGQKSYQYVLKISEGIKNLGGKSWVYQEGSDREFYIVEFSKNFLANFQIESNQDKLDYIRGYFDTDGGIAKNNNVRYYIYFAQKDLTDLQYVRNLLVTNNIKCGTIHNPSCKIDPNYWRFYISAKSYQDFAIKIGSWHPDKQKFIRMKI